MAIPTVQSTNYLENPLALAGLGELGLAGKVASLALPYIVENGTKAILERIGGENQPKPTDNLESAARNEAIANITGRILGFGTGAGVGLLGTSATVVGLTALAVGTGPLAPALLGTGAALTFLASPVGNVAGEVGKYGTHKLLNKVV